MFQLIVAALLFFTSEASCTYESDQKFLEAFSSMSEYSQVGFINPKNMGKFSDAPSVQEGESGRYKSTHVNVITGRNSGYELDYVLPGPVPINIERYHDDLGLEAANHAGWQFFHERIAVVCLGDHKVSLRAYEVTGDLTGYTNNNNMKYLNMPYKIIDKHFEKGLVNSYQGELTGATNKKNQAALIPTNNEVILTDSDGTKKIYIPNHKNKQLYKTNDMQVCLLSEIIKPSGHHIIYETYLKDGNLPTLVLKSTNPAKDKVFSSVELIMGLPEKDGATTLTLSGSDQRLITYSEKNLKKGENLIESVTGREQGDINYEYHKKHSYISKKVMPNQGCYEILYYRDKKTVDKLPPLESPKHGFEFKNSDEKAIVECSPVGDDETPIATAYYCYYQKKGKGNDQEGYTNTFDAYGNKTTHHYNRNRRITACERYLSDGSLYQSEHMVFDENPESKNYTNLLCRYWKNASGDILSARTFIYDNVGNVIEEKLWGNLSGICAVPVKLDSTGLPIANGVEFFSKKYTYSNDIFHLKLSEESKENVVTHFSYLKGTNLPLSEIVKVNGKIYERCFFQYDRDNLLVEKIADDGSGEHLNDLTGAKERHIIRIQPKQSAPGMGLAEVVEELYFDFHTKQEKLISRKVNTYLDNCRIGTQSTYDADDNLYFIEYYEYDALGRLIYKTDPRGNEYHYQYDKCGNKIYESSRPDVYTEYFYDHVNRPIRIEIHHADGLHQTSKNKYNYLNQKISTTDTFGTEMFFEYDPYGNLLKVTGAPLIDEEGEEHASTICKKYDGFGRVIEEIDPKGFVTKISHNIEGKPIHVHYPDDTDEYFEYNLSGTLKRAILKNGTSITCEYDYKDREIRKDTFGTDGTLLKREEKTYSAFKLTSETDASGCVTYHNYDGAGRLSETLKNKSRTTFEYDSLGALYKKTVWDEERDYIAFITVRDIYGQEIEERIETPEGIQKQIKYAYDNFGNKTETIIFTEQPGVFSVRYNSLNEPITLTDPLGNTSHIAYNRSFYNALGQNVLQVTRTDPMGTQSLTTLDAAGRIASEEITNPLNEIILSTEIFYDHSGNKSCIHNHVYESGQKCKTVTMKWQYGPLNRLEKETEACGTQDEQARELEYTHGLLTTSFEASGITKHFEYDPLGRLLRHYTKGPHPVDYYYSYNSTDLPILVEDAIQHTHTKRTYDSSGQLTKEELANGCFLDFTYDAMGRCTSYTLHDGSSVKTTYCGLSFKDITRLDAMGNTLYSHTYEERDLCLHPKKAQSPIGPIIYNWDIIGRFSGIKAQNFETNVGAFDPLGNVLEVTRNVYFQNHHYHYNYDFGCQLKEESGIFNHTYLHDSLNNRLQVDDKSYSFNALSQVETHSYDLAGNLLQKDDYHFLYDDLNRLISCNTTEYTYDAFNRRMTKRGPDENLNFIYIENNEIGATNQDGAIIQLRILGEGLGAELGAAIAFELNGRLYIPLHDHRGSLAALSDISGRIVMNYEISAFGQFEKQPHKQSISQHFINALFHNIHSSPSVIPLHLLQDYVQKDPLTINVPWLFCSKRFDGESGLFYFGRRYYDPDMGRWITKDPNGFNDGPNLYAYSHNNPTSKFDLYGLETAAPAETESSWFDDTIDFVRFCVGNLVRTIGNELPIPYVRLGVKAFGNLIEHGSFSNADGSALQDHSQIVPVGTRETPGKIITCVNGIWNSLTEGLEFAKMISKSHGNAIVYLMYNSSHGIILDVLECAANVLGIPTRASEVVGWGLHHFSQRALNENAEVFHYAHSQGGLLTGKNLHHLSKNERSVLHIRTFGSAYMIPNGEVASCVNCVNLLDPVPWIGDFFGMASAVCGFNVHLHVLPSLIPFNHAFACDSYSHMWGGHCGTLFQQMLHW